MIGKMFLGNGEIGTRLGVVAVAAVVAIVTAGCASGGSGNSDEERRVLPEQRRNVLRVGGYREVEMYNEAGVGVRTLEMPAATVWGVLGGVYEQMGIPVEQADPRAMQLGNQGYTARRVERDRMNTFVDCGSDLAGPLANQYDVTLTVVTRLTAKTPESTEVVTMVDAYARPRAVSGNPLHCQSRGELEDRIGQRIAEALGLEPS